MGKIFAIARIMNGKETLGLRIVDVEDKKAAPKDVSIANIKKVLAGGSVTIENIGLIGGELIGTNGSIDRLAPITARGDLLGASPLVVINRIGDAGYTVIDYKGTIKKATNADAINYAKKHGIANGKVVVKDSLEFISSIVGEYDVKEISASKYGTKTGITLSVPINSNLKSVANHTKTEVQDELDNRDVFRSMTPQQKKVIQDYYMWYTVELYESFTKGNRLQRKGSKVETLAHLRGEDNWKYAGWKDLGFNGAGTCELGHPIRHAHYANNVDENGNIIETIVFGETCVADFFLISKEDMAKLIKVRMAMSDEISIMADIVANHTEKEAWGKLQLLLDILRKITGRPDGKDAIYKVFGHKIGNTLANFLNVNLPYPETLVLQAKEKLTKLGVAGFWKEVFPEYADTITEIVDAQDYYGLNAQARDYLEFVAKIKIAGPHGYDPTVYERDPETHEQKNMKVGKNDTLGRQYNNPKDKLGGFAQKDAQQRREFLYRIRKYTRCKNFTFSEVEGLIKNVKYFTLGNKKMRELDRKLRETCGMGLLGKLSSIDEDNELYDAAYMLLKDNNKISTSERLFKYRDRYNYITVEDLAELMFKTDTKEFDDAINTLIQEEIDKKAELDRILREEEQRRKEKEEEERRLAEERRRQQEEENRKAIEEAMRLKYEQAAKQAEADKIEEDTKKDSDRADESGTRSKEDRLSKLAELIRKHPSVEDTYITKIAKDICNRGLTFDKLSYKQVKIIEQAEAIYYKADGKDIPKEFANNSYTFDEKPNVKEEVEKILSVKNNKEIHDKLIIISPKIFEIAETVQKTKKVSDKQYKHIQAGINIINLLMD